MKMHKILTSPYRRRDGTWSKRRIVLATFLIYSDATAYIDALRKRQEWMQPPARWILELVEPSRLRGKKGGSE